MCARITRIRAFFKTYWYVYGICLLVVEPLGWFSFADKMEKIGIVGYLILILAPACLITVIFVGAALLQKIQKPSNRLTPEKPKETYSNRWRWRKARKKCEYTQLLGELEATMLITLPGLSIEQFVLSYDENNTEFKTYEEVMSREVQVALERWKAENPSRFQELQEEPCGLQVRLEKFTFDHNNYQYKIMLSPIKFLYYQAIQSRLWERSNASLRKNVFDNALTSLIEGKQPLLPNHFALHMAIVSIDEQLLIRKRSATTPLFPSVWEASIGEFMHGPVHKDFPHFTDERQPNLGLFCVNAVFEETNYRYAKPNQFKIYGFGVEYRTLAPKLYVIFKSDLPMVNLLSQGSPKDRGLELSSVDLTPQALAKKFSKGSGYLWSPSSRIISLSVLANSATNKWDRELRLKKFSKNYTE